MPTFGSFADLSKYQRAAAQPAVDPLESLAQGFNQGQALQRLPQTLQEQRQLQVLDRLQKQLAVATAQQRLADLQNPDAALARRVREQLTLKGALNPDLGISQGIGEVVQTPGALTPQQQQSLTMQQVAADAGGVPVVQPTVAAGQPITPIALNGIQTGLSLDPAVPRAAEARKQSFDLNKLIQEETVKAGFRDATEQVSPGQIIARRNPDGSYTNVFQAPAKAETLGAPQFVKSLTDPKDIKLVHIDASGQPPQGYEFLKTAEGQMKPSEKITAQREVRTVYDELPAKIDFFGKGQIPGSNQLKTRLDAVLVPVKGDFTKLNPQAKQTFVFAINKLRDPSSATLLAEARQIADRAGIGDRFGAFIQNYTEGDPLPDQVAKDIYEVISQVHAAHKENLIQSLIPIKDDADLLGKKLTSFGVPKDIQDEVERRIANPNTPQSSVNAATSPRTLSTGLIIRQVK